MPTIDFLERYLRASRESRDVRIASGDRIDQGQVDKVSVDSGPNRDFVRVTIKIPIPHCEGE